MNNYICPTKEQLKDWTRMWHVEIEERPRHLWPDKWIVTGWYCDEKYAYKDAEYQWEQEQNKKWNEKNKDKPPPPLWGLLIGGDDYFYWHVETPGWSLHKDLTWHKMLINDKNEFTGVYDSYEEAVATLAKLPACPPKFENYEEHLNEVIKRLVV